MMENVHNGTEQEPIAEENDSTKTTWDDIAAMHDKMGQLETPSDESDTSTSENASNNTPEDDLRASLERIEQMHLSDAELVELTANWSDVEVDQAALQGANKKDGTPNAFSGGLFLGGNLPMHEDSVYRHVGTAAISDLFAQGFVRNKREAANAMDVPGKLGFGTSGATVYWNEGNSQKLEKADLVIQASRAAAEEGYVTKDGIQGIWVTDKKTGQPVNLIDGQDHSGLEMAPHRR